MGRLFIESICLIALCGIQAQSSTDPNWRQIVPGRTTRPEVERLLGPAPDTYSASYDLREGNLFIAYSIGPCGSEKKGGWNLPKDTVVEVTFTPKKKRSVAKLKLDMNRYRRVVNTHTGGVTYYISDRDSITYEVQRGKVDAITYEPPINLYCGDIDLFRNRMPPEGVADQLSVGLVQNCRRIGYKGFLKQQKLH